MTLPNEIIIIGGGKSIREGINLGLNNQLKNKFVILTNYSFKHFNGTFLAFADREFYVPNYAKHYADPKTIRHPDIYEELRELPLIIGINHSGIEEFKLSNTILTESNQFYHPNFLTGIFSMSLACFLMNYCGQIFLLGFDWTTGGATHYYSKQEINHRGQGWTNSYRAHNPTKIFNYFNKFKNMKIYNVSLQSNITNFEKITYNKMVELLDKKKINQEDLRQEIKSQLF